MCNPPCIDVAVPFESAWFAPIIELIATPTIREVPGWSSKCQLALLDGCQANVPGYDRATRLARQRDPQAKFSVRQLSDVRLNPALGVVPRQHGPIPRA